MLRFTYHRESLQKRKDLCSIVKVSTGKLAYNERMASDLSIIEEIDKCCTCLSQVRDPYRRVNENHSTEFLVWKLA